MTFKLRWASTFCGCSEDYHSIEVNSLEQLEELQEQNDYPLIIDFKEKTILIYDDYIE